MLPKLKEGLLLFYRYTRACLDYQEITGKMSADDAQKIKDMADGKIEPSKSLLKKYFRGAMSNYKKSCLANGLEANFSPESVENHWRNCHGHTDDCAVRIGVIYLVDDNMVKATINGQELHVINLYGFKLRRNDKFFIHRRVLVERAD